MNKTLLVLPLMTMVLLFSSCDNNYANIKIPQRSNTSGYGTSEEITQKQIGTTEQPKEPMVREEEKRPVSETEYLMWYEKEDEYVNFNHPYVKWLIDKKGNGTFNLYLTIKANTSPELVNSELSKFGTLGSSGCYEKCRVYLEVTDFSIIKELFSYSFIEDVYISNIVSDYKLNVSLEEMKTCNVNEDCKIVGTGCCSGANNCNLEAINKEYVDLWNTQIYCYGVPCLAAVMCRNAFYVNCTMGQCTLTQDTCFNYIYAENGAYLIKFKENTPETEVDNILRPLSDLEPKLNYKIEFPFDVYTFPLSTTCGPADIWCYVGATDEFITYLNNNQNVNAFVSDYGQQISLIVNNEKMNGEDVLALVNSYNDTIKIENISVQKGFYGFYNTKYNSGDFVRYICDNIENNPHIESFNHINVWLYEMYEIIVGCTNRSSFFPIIKPDRC